MQTKTLIVRNAHPTKSRVNLYYNDAFKPAGEARKGVWSDIVYFYTLVQPDGTVMSLTVHFTDPFFNYPILHYPASATLDIPWFHEMMSKMLLLPMSEIYLGTHGTYRMEEDYNGSNLLALYGIAPY